MLFKKMLSEFCKHALNIYFENVAKLGRGGKKVNTVIMYEILKRLKLLKLDFSKV